MENMTDHNDENSEVSSGVNRRQREVAEGPNDIVLVTGGSGFLGQHIVYLLQTRAPHVKEIRILDLHAYRNMLSPHEEKPVRMFKGCITDQVILKKALNGVSSVFHIAGKISYGTFPDYAQMNRINVEGTCKVIKACLDANVTRLIYCSTVDVAIGNNDIINGSETTTHLPRKFLFPGYPESKYKAECAVLQANGQHTAKGLPMNTLSLRANVMYGEEDPYYITSGLRNTHMSGGTMYQVGNGTAKFQPVYVGNTAWAFICADKALRDQPDLGGQFYYIPDDTPVQNTFQFMCNFLEIRGFQLSQIKLPFLPIYYGLKFMEWIAQILSPIYRFHLSTESYTVKYINMNLYFTRSKAEKELGFKPIFSPSEALERSLQYYKNLQL